MIHHKTNKNMKHIRERLNEIEIADIDINTADYPDFTDSFITEAYLDGVELTDDEYDYINCECYDWLYEQIVDWVY